MHRTLAAAGITILLSASVARADLPIRTVALSGQSAPGTSAPFLNFYYAAINSAGQVAFTAQLDLGPPDSFEVGIWSEGSGTLANVARVNQNAPGTSDQFQDFLAGDEQVILDDAGNVTFPAYTTGSTVTPAGIWMGGTGSLQPYSLQNSPAPGTGTTFAYPQAFVINPAGTITFHARLNDPAIIREGIWTTLGGALHPIVIDGSPAPGLPGSILSGIGNPSVNRSGTIAFSASYYPTSSNTNLSSALWVGDAVGPTPRYFSGSVAPGTGGLTFASFNDVDLNNAGKVAFSGYVSGASPSASYGYWSDAGGSLQLVARQGDPAVGMPGLTYSLLDRFNISTSGRVEFTATTLGTGGANHYGIWAGLPGNVQLVAGDGMPAPGMPGATFTSFSAADLNSSGLLVFEAYVQGSITGPGIWADDPQGNLFPVVLPTDSLGTGKQIEAIDLLPGDDGSGQPRFLNDDGQLAFVAAFKDDNQGVFVVTVPEPATFWALAGVMLLARRVRRRPH